MGRGIGFDVSKTVVHTEYTFSRLSPGRKKMQRVSYNGGASGQSTNTIGPYHPGCEVDP